MNKEGLIIDFASTNVADKTLVAELNLNGGKYYCLGKRKSIFLYSYNLKKILKENKYDIVHVNGNSSTMALELFLAKIMGVQKRIAHVHASNSNYPIINAMVKPMFKRCYTDGIAVSKESGEKLFGNNYVILNNAIDTQKYKFNNDVRKEVRKNFNVSDKTVLGNVGKLNRNKNQIFLLHIFKELLKIDSSYCLMIVGGGELEKELKGEAKSLEIGDNVIFTGMRNDIEKIIQAFDIFLFPSIIEGLGMVTIEAQAAGLHCLISDTVPKETEVSQLAHYLPLSNFQKWFDLILQYKNQDYDRTTFSNTAIKSIDEHGYDIGTRANDLRKIYLCN